MRLWDRLEVRLLGSVAAVALAMSLASFGWDAYRQRLDAERTLTDRARAVTKQFLAVRSFVAQAETERAQAEPGSFHHLDPVVVARVVGEIFGAGSAATVREVWVGAGSPEHRPDPVEQAALARFEENPCVTEYAVVSGPEATQAAGGPEGAPGTGRLFRYVAPIYLEESCLSCHQQSALVGRHGAEPPSVGDLMGAISIAVPIDSFEASVASAIRERLWFTVYLTGISLAVLAFLLRRQVTGPLGQLTAMASRFATGDLRPAPVPRGAAGETAMLASVMNNMAAALRELYEDLESKVEERTRRLQEANAILRQKQAELERAQQLQSEFLATVSHELRTPLTSILAFTELLLEEDRVAQDAALREYLADIRECAQRLYGQINDLLDLARIEAGRMQLDRQLFDVREAVEACLRRIEPLATRKGLAVLHPQVAEPVWVEADRSRVEQILMNLLSNAVKFTRAGRIAVEIVPAAAPDGGMVQIDVSDTGIGIRPEHQAIIFEKFRQVDSSASREYPGSGLGLALARHLVEMHGGRIWVRSTPGEGSTFSFTLPAAARVPARRARG
ncbi:MAG TPA: ATP-binding protein [Limnochordales bacterium]